MKFLSKKILLAFSLTLNLTITMTAQAQQVGVENIPLTVGIFKDVPMPTAPSSISTGGTYKNCAKISYNDMTKVLRINPVKEGFCTLIIKSAANDQVAFNFTLDVKKTDINKVVREIKGLLNEVEGIEIKVANNKVVVDGQVLLPQEIGRIHTVVKQYGDLATSLVTLSPIAQQKIAQFIERAIGNPEIRAKAVNGKYVLEGIAESKDDRERAQVIAETYVPDIVVDEPVADKKIQERVTSAVINLITVREAAAPEPSKMVQIIVHYVELQKDYSKGFRFQWTPGIGDESNVSFSSGDRGPAGLTSTITGTISNLLPKLNWAKEHGHARVLQSSSIIVENGKPGTLNATQDIPYKTLGESGQFTTSFASAGIETTITPNIVGSRSDSVNLKLDFKISSLIGSVSNAPLISRRLINTQVVVRSSQSAAIGGLISSDTATGYNKLPDGANANPIISLYASKDFRKNQSQFVVFVTPVIKASASAGSEAIKRKFRLRE